MILSEIESSVHESIDAGDPDTLSLYAEHAAESANPLVEALCLAIIGTDHRAWSAVLAVASQRAPDLADSLESLERHIDRQRAAFIEARARNIQDVADHNAICLAELQAELNRGVI